MSMITDIIRKNIRILDPTWLSDAEKEILDQLERRRIEREEKIGNILGWGVLFEDGTIGTAKRPEDADRIIRNGKGSERDYRVPVFPIRFPSGDCISSTDSNV